MNDRYLYRAKRKNWRELPKEMWWVEGYLYGIWERRYILWGMTNDVPNMVEVDPSTICQCTGLKDKNNKLIWENDIVDASLGWWHASDPAGHDSKIIKVEWDDGYCGFTPFADYDCDCGVYIESNDVKVIGNIFDNPELLEK